MKNAKKYIAVMTAALLLSGCGAGYDDSGSGGASYIAPNDAPAATMPAADNAGKPDSADNKGSLQHADASNGGASPAQESFDGVWETWTEAEAPASNDWNDFPEEVFPSHISDPDAFYTDYFNTEEYNYIKESGYTSSVANPLSTFSVDVDTASYTNLRRQITGGYDIVPDAIRIEEMINYFDYGYPQPHENEPFSVTTEVSDCPWNRNAKLALIGIHTKDIDLSERPPMNIVFLIDVSGSMYSNDKLPLVQKSFSMLTENLTEQDRVSIVTYAGSDEVVLEGADGNDQKKILRAINSLSAGGSTAGAAGIATAYKIAEKYFIEGGNNRIVLATDGDLNVGISSESDLISLIEEKRETGVFLSVLGFGTGNIKDNKMEALADNGNGNYSYIDSEAEAKRVLVNEMSGTLFTAAKDVKIQVEFNPAYVKGYRLIGYENRALADEDFNDDTKDAGEIGAGHSVTALYEILTSESDTELSTSELKYRNEENIGVKNCEWLTVSIRYKAPDSDTSKLMTSVVNGNIYSRNMSGRMTFAAGVAEFGLVLRGSEYKGNATCQNVLTLLADYDYADDEYKDEFIYLVKLMKKQGF